MRNNLLSIGEVARMKGVGIKALRYYERIGVLRPAFVDAQTGYRYYALGQMPELDVIITCVELGLPLKELRRYRTAEGRLDLDALLEHGRLLALENLRRARAIVMQVEGYQREVALQQRLREGPAPYERALEPRLALAIPWKGDAFDAKRYAKAATELYEQAKERRLVPLYLQGMARLPAAEGGSAWHVVLEAAAPAKGAAPDGLLQLPGGTFSGERIERDDFEAAFAAAFAAAADVPPERAVLALDIWDDELRPDRFTLELLHER
ncbi:MerR family transcriptional regulator [Arabiibacter massiliensis]|uniref:MerR family transcriptional regulator n=1 Tax=Arabiibacter massiliensis TaxID=1870985 RepID=UPI0009BA6AC6|nr:MerR family transcriptional regulator [Arabiibacter massiliensis]